MGKERRRRLFARGARTCFAVALSFCTSARAHGPTEIFQVLSSEPGDVVLATSRGLIFGTFAPRAWSLACSEGFDLPSGERYQVARLWSGRLLLAAHSGGVRFSDDRACTWRALPALAGRPAPLLVQHPHDLQRLYVIVEQAGQSTLQRSRDGGASFETLYTVPQSATVRSLLVTSSSEPAEIYLSATVGPSYAPTGHFVARGSDGPESWTRFDVVLGAGELDLTLLAAKDGALIARASAREPSRGERLLVSADGGATFSPWGSLRMLRAAAFGEDGRAYAAGVDGVVRIDLRTGAADAARGAWMHLVEQRAEGLFVSGYHAGIEAQWDGLAWLDPRADTFAPFMSFYEVSEAIPCPDVTREQRCAPLLADFVREHPAPSPPPLHVLPPARDASARPAADAGEATGDDGGWTSADAALPTAAFDASAAATLDARPSSPEDVERDAASNATEAAAPSARPSDGCSTTSRGSAAAAWLAIALLATRRWRRR